MNKVVSIFRELLNKPVSEIQVPPIPQLSETQEAWLPLVSRDLTGYKLHTPMGRLILERCTQEGPAPVGSVYSPRTNRCGVNGIRIPVTAGKPYHVIATYIGHCKGKDPVYFFQFQCDDGSIHLANPNDCEFIGRALSAA